MEQSIRQLVRLPVYSGHPSFFGQSVLAGGFAAALAGSDYTAGGAGFSGRLALPFYGCLAQPIMLTE